jgi:SAM-dependent methyltransferase
MSLAFLHENIVKPRRTSLLAQLLSERLPPSGSVLDIGAGSGEITAAIGEIRPDIKLRGVDVHARREQLFAVDLYDGKTLPYETGAFDAAILIDVLHHTHNPAELLVEAMRVATTCVIIKDHLCEGKLDELVLGFMDRVGNQRFGVASPGTYLSRREWERVFKDVGALRVFWRDRLGLYPFPLSLVFERGLHFIAELSHAE